MDHKNTKFQQKIRPDNVGPASLIVEPTHKNQC